MRFIGNILWLLLGGLEAAIGYFSGTLALAITIVGIPVALQTFKLGLLCLWPFGARVESTDSPIGCIRIPLNILWMVFGGLWAWLMHILFGLLWPSPLSVYLLPSNISRWRDLSWLLLARM